MFEKLLRAVLTVFLASLATSAAAMAPAGAELEGYSQ
jgi:hypothetical protein